MYTIIITTVVSLNFLEGWGKGFEEELYGLSQGRMDSVVAKLL